MEKIENEYLEREFANNYQTHELFNYQRRETIDSIMNRINDNPNGDILLQININNIMPFYKHRNNFINNSVEEYNYWNHVVSILFMSQLKEKYDFNTIHDIDKEKRIITREPFDDYKKTEPALLNRNDVIELIKNLNFDNPRLHIVIKHFNNEDIWNELVNYFDDDLPFITMIYSDCDVYRFFAKSNDCPSDNYKYKFFDKSREGIESYKLENYKDEVLKYEKKI